MQLPPLSPLPPLSTLPELSAIQKSKFESAFKAIIEQTSPEIKAMWTGKIYWAADLPHFDNNIHQKLTGKLAHDYLALTNKLKGRNL